MKVILFIISRHIFQILKAELGKQADNNLGFLYKTRSSLAQKLHHKIPAFSQHQIYRGRGEEKQHQARIHFKTSQRQYITKEILDSIVYADNNVSKMSRFWSRVTRSYNRNSNIRLVRLLNEGILNSAFPLHDVNLGF